MSEMSGEKKEPVCIRNGFTGRKNLCGFFYLAYNHHILGREYTFIGKYTEWA